MPKKIRKCRNCGKEYEYCRSHKVSKEFRWQDVACSPECGSEYLEKVLIARGELEPKYVDNTCDETLIESDISSYDEPDNDSVEESDEESDDEDFNTIVDMG